MNGQVRVQLSEEGLAPQGQPLYLVILGLTILVMTLLRVIVPMIETPRPGFLLFVLYAVLHLTVLLPLKIWSLLTMARGGWGSRNGTRLSASSRWGRAPPMTGWPSGVVGRRPPEYVTRR